MGDQLHQHSTLLAVCNIIMLFWVANFIRFYLWIKCNDDDAATSTELQRQLELDLSHHLKSALLPCPPTTADELLFLVTQVCNDVCNSSL